MGSLKKFDGSSWINSNLRKLTTDTDTFTTFPAIIYAERTNATVGLKGNTVQSSTPTPDSPIMPQGTGERTENLFELSDNSATENILKTLVDFGEDVTFDIITCSCVFENFEAEGTYSAFVDYLMNDGTHQYVSLSAMLNVNDDSRIPANVKVNGNYYNIKQNITFRKIQVYLYTTGYNKFKSGNIKWAFYNSDKKDYEPYGYKILISSANTTTPVYLGEVETTRRIKKLVLDGTENWLLSTAQAGRFGLSLSDYLKSNETITSFCSHYMAIAQKSGGTVPNNSQYFYSGSDAAKYLFIVDTNCSTAADFKSFLQQQFAAGTPVTVWYVLATEETAVVNEPLMKIGDYADTVSSISIPITAGGDTLSVGTTVQPSEVTANYYGWHTITVHERESGQWD